MDAAGSINALVLLMGLLLSSAASFLLAPFLFLLVISKHGLDELVSRPTCGKSCLAMAKSESLGSVEFSNEVFAASRRFH